MALFQATNITPSLFAGEGNGTVAANDPIVISWQINGTDAMTGFRILISKNDTASTEVHGVTATDGCPAYGTNANGEQQIFTYAPTDSSGKPVKWSDWGLTDGAEYKMNITIYWGTVQSTPFVNLYSPAVFRTRTAPSLAIAVPVTVDKAYTTISGGYGQEQGDAISWVRWQLYLGVSTHYGDYLPSQLLDDTGKMTTGDLQYEADGLLNDKVYFMKLTIQTESGVQKSVQSEFSVKYAIAASENTLEVEKLSNGANLLCYGLGNATGGYTNCRVYRREYGNNANMRLLGEFSLRGGQIRDFAARNGTAYVYEIYLRDDNKLLNPKSSPPITHDIDSYILMEATEDANYRNVWHVRDVWNFAYNIQHSEISNNNTPNMMANFTPYRRRQPSTIHGKSGTLQALIGDMDFGEYGDTWQRMEKLFAISSGVKTFFLKDAKGNLYMVGISAPVTQTIAIGNERKQVMASISWEEIGDASDAVLIQTPDDEGWVNSNMVSQVMADADMETGQLEFMYPADYKGTTFDINETMDSILESVTPDTVTPVTYYHISSDDGALYVTEGEL
jgi:hypothetical protein